ncbi:E3 ubiquitin-protein ligase TRIM9-like isoform X1 [Anopheles albimanus]|uniref:E3 ubiquitin-protein ligase TRIM9-like isoform X1 n=1 Tax=Anopheles albimanus TaxID=7167 RepID=UPI00163DFCAB|nr:E3 ubiquitin-protein ligase TRIM9-like isoform X1 [Anopheles albimanus]XP_035773271.1 E3 ubiquitin-protein ligase TRIM9-like isoform X1 [Anopheles albimanus]XP_035773272.1 E3 ubiquitin-protein ligase TRIM9-like isoform X1 [Anopheles albimanus]XP_035773273.1 E3 ubiquitin-protein ligase TRIM9-like isoform X1 [Anopheles albimanus]
MEEELRCPVCKQLYSSPVLLPCYHALCLACALDIQTATSSSSSSSAVAASSSSASSSSSGSGAVVQLHQHQHHHPGPSSSSSASSSSSSASSTTGSSSATESVSSDQDQADKVSILSEADSGVICCTSRPGSYAGTPNLQGLLFPPSGSGSSVYSLVCPVCRKLVFFDELGARNLPLYRAMESIVDRFCEREALRCQMCETEPPKVATVICEQCEIRYCDACRELCHPARGPLAKHSLTKPRGACQLRESICGEHTEPLTMYCMGCKLPICNQCIGEQNRHQSHDLQSITAMCKAQKTELSHNLQQLSEKARSTTEFIQRLKGMSDKVTDTCIEFERVVTAQCEALIAAIHARRDVLLDVIRSDKEAKIRTLKDQQASCTGKLQQTTGLIQFCIEALKETDSAAFLQVGSMLINRVANTDMTWHQEVTNAAPRVSPIIDLTLDESSVIRAIDNLTFIQMKPAKEGEERLPAVPLAPIIIPEDCSAENNSVTVAWQAPGHSFVQGYVLELDDGSGGEFREVYCGKETICTVDGLHFNSMYNARVKAFNNTGEGEYSELIGLQTAEVAWFTFDSVLSGGPCSGLNFSTDNQTVSADGWEHRVALGSVGFSRGVHYWEFTIDKYTADTDPAFGVARLDVARDKMLGKDDKGFAMYIDRQRSWFQHNSVHERRVEGGISTGSTVGVLLDLERHTLHFIVNEMPQGSVAFRDLYGVFYPAVSVNRGVTLTLHTGLDAPHMDYH